MREYTAPVLFESSQHHQVLQDPANADWIALIQQLDGPTFEILARRYYMALYHFRKHRTRRMMPGQVVLFTAGRQEALKGMLERLEERKEARKQTEGSPSADEVFVEPHPLRDLEELPAALKDFSNLPPSLDRLLAGPGRPPCDAVCLMRAFLAAPLVGVDDHPSAVFRLLHSNPTFAYLCGFAGPKVHKQAGERTSRRLPSRALCEEFSEVMTRYGLWHHARLTVVEQNLETGVIAAEDTLAFDTTHIKANSECTRVVPAKPVNEDADKPKQRKVPRVTKRCRCGQEQWESCPHPWGPTDDSAAVVCKAPTRIYWAHKAAVVSLGRSEIPVDARVCRYAAEHDGNTLVPHLCLLQRCLPRLVAMLLYVLADSAYLGRHEEVARFGNHARLLTPVKGRKARKGLADEFPGIKHFTPTGVPVCDMEHRFTLLGRDIERERFIWAAPDDEHGTSVCNDCPCAQRCLRKRARRRHLRVARRDQPHINWEHPQHFAADRKRYRRRTGVERAIKRIKNDLRGEHLTHRGGLRVQAHLDRKLLILHLLLRSGASP